MKSPKNFVTVSRKAASMDVQSFGWYATSEVQDRVHGGEFCTGDMRSCRAQCLGVGGPCSQPSGEDFRQDFSRTLRPKVVRGMQWADG